MIMGEHRLPIMKQAKALRINRSSVYYLPRPALERAAPGLPIKPGPRRLIPLTQVRLYVVSAARGTGRRVCEDCLA
jgi:hypothetical protein